jgi:tetratricopeptide (TPR) repeat protein
LKIAGRNFLALALLYSLIGALAPEARADNSLNCTFVDDAGNPVPKLEVVLTLTSTGKQWKKKTNDKGLAEFKGLDDGSYRLDGVLEGHILSNTDPIALSGNAAKACTQKFISINRVNQLLTETSESVRTQKYDVALEKGKAAVELAPNVPNTHFVLALAYAKKGMVDEAMGSIKRAAEMDAENFGKMVNTVHMEALGTQASAALNKKDFPGAIQKYQEILAIAPNDPVVYYNIALAYGHKGDFESALKAIDKAIELDPNDQEFRQRKTQLQDMYLKSTELKLP